MISPWSSFPPASPPALLFARRRRCLARPHRQGQRKLHAFTEVYASEARALADAADKARASGFPLGPLHGLPVVYKDLCDIAGRIGTGGSKMFEKRVASETYQHRRAADRRRHGAARQDAHGRVRLRRLGHQSPDGRAVESLDLATMRVPRRFVERHRGGRLRPLAPAGIGSGHRWLGAHPAAFNGLVGLKVTFGRIGFPARCCLSWTLDSIARCALRRGLRLVLERAGAPDPRDPTTSPAVEDFSLAIQPGSIEGMRVASLTPSSLPASCMPT